MNNSIEEIYLSPKKILTLMESKGISINKKLGQNFLINRKIVKKIVKLSNVENYGVIEIGAGLGVLTMELSKFAKKIVSLEIDKGLFKILQDQFHNKTNVEFLNCDVLKLNLKELILSKFNNLNVKICANLPYYLTSSFIAGVLESKICNLKEIILMIQKEAAQRLSAKPGSKDCSAISYLIHYYSNPKIEFDVLNGNFFPKPKVKSSILTLKLNKKIDKVDNFNENLFFKFIRVAFSQRRKFMLTPISKFYKVDKVKLQQILDKLNLRYDIRANQLSLDEFKCIFTEFQKLF